MATPEERWDVVVVGLHDPRPDKLGHLARHLARVCEMPIDELVEALQDGEVPVYSGLRRHEAERAAHQLDAFGAAVDLRLAVATSGVYPILKPDAERRSGTAVGGFIDDSATPPRIADSRIGQLPLEPAAAEDHIGPVAPSPPSVGPASARKTTASEAPIVTRRRTIGEAPGSVPPARPPEGHSASPVSDPFGALASGLERLSAEDALDMLGGLGDDRVEPRDVADRSTPRDGQRASGSSGDRSRGVEPASSEPPPSGAEAPPPPPRRGPIAPAVAAASSEPKATPKDPFAAPGAESDLQLDFEAAGMSRPPTPTLSRAVKPGHSGVLPRRTRAIDSGGTGAAARGFGVQAEVEKGPLMGPEPVSATIFGLAAGLAIGLFAAVLLQKGAEQESIVGWEAEVQQALAAPDDVEAGKVRPASAIESDLEEAYGDIRRTFLLQWLAIGIPIGLVLGRLKRW